jgi:hypothetical protein
VSRAEEWLSVPAALATVVLSVVLAVWVYNAGSSSEQSGRSPAAVGNVTDSAQSVDQATPLARNPEALMLAQRSRDVLVGLAALPGGPVDVVIPDRARLQVARIEAAVGSDRVEPSRCGRACFRLSASVMRGNPVAVSIRVRRPGEQADTVRFLLPARPPPSGDALFAAADRRMRALRSVRVAETLTSGYGVVTARYLVRAPDRLALETRGQRVVIIIGNRRWELEGSRWVATPFPRTRFPSYFWSRASHARLLGVKQIDGRSVKVLAVFNGRQGPSWFRLFVARDNRVLSAEMLAPSHFMTHIFSGFDRPLRIERPS